MADSEDEALPFDISEDLVPSRMQKSAGGLTLDFDGLLSTPLKLHEDVKEGNGGQAWPAGMTLAKFLLKYHRSELESKSMFVCPRILADCHISRSLAHQRTLQSRTRRRRRACGVSERLSTAPTAA